MTQNILIEFSSDTKGITLAEQAVKEFAGVDKELSKNFATTNNSLKQRQEIVNSLSTGLNGLVNKLKDAEKAALGAFGTKGINEYNKSLVNSTNVVKLLATSVAAASEKLKTLGSGTPEFEKLNTEVLRGKELLQQYSASLGDAEAKSSSFAGSLSKGYGLLRTIANIVPNLGISTIFLYLSQGVESVISSLFKEKEAVVQFTEEEVKAREKVSSSMGEEIAKVTSLKVVLDSEVASRDQKKRALKELIDVQPEYFKGLTLEGDKIDGLSTAYDNYTGSLLKTAKTKASLNIIQDLYKKRLDFELQATEDLTKVEQRFQDFQNKTQEAFKKGSVLPVQTFDAATRSNIGLLASIKDIDIQLSNLFKTIGKDKESLDAVLGKPDKDKTDKAAKDIQDYYLNVLKQKREIDKLILESEAGLYKNIYTNEKESFLIRLDNLSSFTVTQTKLLEIQKQDELDVIDEKLKADLSKHRLNEKQRADILEASVLERQKVELSFYKRLQELREADYSEQQKINDKMLQGLSAEEAKKQALIVKSVTDRFAQIANTNDTEEIARIKALNDAFSEGLITYGEFLKKRDDLSKEYKKRELSNEVSKFQAILADTQLADDQRLEYEKKLNVALKALYGDNVTDFSKAQGDKINAMNKALSIVSSHLSAFGLARKKLDDQIYNNAIVNAKTDAERQAADIDRTQKTVDRKVAAEEFYGNYVKQLTDANFDHKKQQLEEEDSANKDLLDRKIITQDEYNKRQKKLKEEEAAIEKRKAIFDILLETTKKIFQIETTAAVLAANPLTIAAAPLAYAQIPQILVEQGLALAFVAARKFKTGKIRIDGPGSETSDSIPAYLSRNESVINAAATKKYQPALEAINSMKFEEYIANLPTTNIPQMTALPKWAERSVSGSHIDYDKMADAIDKRMKERFDGIAGVDVSIDKNGIHVIAKEGLNRTQYLNKRYTIK
jgi:hypothetical protein